MLLTAVETTPGTNGDPPYWVNLLLTGGVPLLVLVVSLIGAEYRAKKERQARDASDEKDRATRVREIQYEGVKAAVVEFLRVLDYEVSKIRKFYERRGIAPGEDDNFYDFEDLHRAYEQLELVVKPEIASVAFDLEIYARAAFDGHKTDVGRRVVLRKELIRYVREFLESEPNPAQPNSAEPGVTQSSKHPRQDTKKARRKRLGL